MKKKTSKVPVFLIYAGIIHTIGLALLMPMLITLPGPGGSVVSLPAAIDVEIVPAPLAAKTQSDSEQTSALPSTEAGAGTKADDKGEDVANVSPDAPPAPAEDPAANESTAKKVTPKAATRAKVAPRAAKKPVVQRGRTAKPAVKRAAKTETKIAPFNGALSGLFSPGAPANNRRRLKRLGGARARRGDRRDLAGLGLGIGVGRAGIAVQETLDLRAAEFAQHRRLLFGLHALGGDGDVE